MHVYSENDTAVSKGIYIHTIGAYYILGRYTVKMTLPLAKVCTKTLHCPLHTCLVLDYPENDITVTDCAHHKLRIGIPRKCAVMFSKGVHVGQHVMSSTTHACLEQDYPENDVVIQSSL